MANPVINLATNSITAHTAVGNVTTSATNVVTAASNTILRINSIGISNKSSTLSATVTIQYYRSATGYSIATDVEVPIGYTVYATDSRVKLSLEESDSIRLSASVNSVLDYIIPYDKIAT